MVEDELLELLACALDGGINHKEIRALFRALAEREDARTLIARALEFDRAMADLNAVFERAPAPPDLLPRIIAAAAAGAVADLLSDSEAEDGIVVPGRAPGP